MFFAVLLLIISIVFGYPAWRLQSALSVTLASAPWIGWLWTVGTVAMALLPVAFLVGMRTDHLPTRWHRPAAWITWLGLGGAVILFDVVLLRDFLWVILLFVQHLGGADVFPESNTQWIRLSASTCPAIAVLLSGFCLLSGASATSRTAGDRPGAGSATQPRRPAHCPHFRSARRIDDSPTIC